MLSTDSILSFLNIFDPQLGASSDSTNVEPADTEIHVDCIDLCTSTQWSTLFSHWFMFLTEAVGDSNGTG